MKVEEKGYCRGNVKKVLDSPYMMAYQRCDEDLIQDQAYIQHEKGLALQKIPMTDSIVR